MEKGLYFSDNELVEKSLENPDYFKYIVENYSDKLNRYIKRRTRASNHDVDDILQEIFIKIYRNLNAFDEKLTFSSWVYRIAHNYIIDWYRKEKKHDNIELDEENSTLIFSLAGDENADRDSNYSELNKEIMGLVDTLDLKYKEIIILRFFEDKSYDEISDIMQIPVSLVGARLNRAKNMIKKLLEKTK